VSSVTHWDLEGKKAVPSNRIFISKETDGFDPKQTKDKVLQYLICRRFFDRDDEFLSMALFCIACGWFSGRKTTVNTYLDDILHRCFDHLGNVA